MVEDFIEKPKINLFDLINACFDVGITNEDGSLMPQDEFMERVKAKTTPDQG